jgi:hypothetical protein
LRRPISDIEATQSCAEAFRVMLSMVAKQVLHNWQVVAVDDLKDRTSSASD